MTPLPLFRLFVLRNIKADRFLAGLSVLGVALGVGLFTSITVASHRAVASFEADIRGLSPYTKYEVASTAGIDFDEGIYQAVRSKANAFAVIRTFAYLPGLGESVDINGIEAIRTAGFLGLGPEGGAESLLKEPGGIVITRRLAESRGLQKGAVVPALVYDGRYDLTVVGIADSRQVPATTVIMDIGNFQEFFGKARLLSRIDVEAEEPAASEIRGLLPPGLSLERKARIIENQKALVASFRYNLQFVSLVAILVGVFLLYNTIFISVVKRRPEIGILRGLGAGRKTIVAIFLVQGLLLGMTGAVAGVGLGQAFAYVSVAAVEKTITSMYGTISITDYLLTAHEAAAAVLLGMLISLAASAVPAYESSRILPGESAREGSFEGRYRRQIVPAALAGLALICTGSAASYADYHFMPFPVPYLSYGGILLIILGFTLISPLYLSRVLRLITRTAGRRLSASGSLAAGDMQGSLYRFSVALMSVAISCSLIVSLLIVIISFRGSLLNWITRNISADIYIKPSACRSNFCTYPLSEGLVRELETVPGVAGIDRFRTLSLEYMGQKIVAGFGDTRVSQGFSLRRAEEGRTRESADAKDVGISTFLATRYGLAKGDVMELQTPGGTAKFTVRDVFSSYSTTSGFIYMDRRWLREYWGQDDATQLALYVKEGTDPGEVISRLRDTLGRRYAVDIMNTRELRERVLSIFNRTFAITYAIELIAVAVALIGVVSTLLALVLERKREISIIRYLGGSWSQVREMLVHAALVVGATGVALGTCLGILMSVIFIQVINKVSFGWEIAIRVPAVYLLAVAAGLMITTYAAGLLPGRIARTIDPKRFISFE